MFACLTEILINSQFYNFYENNRANNTKLKLIAKMTADLKNLFIEQKCAKQYILPDDEFENFFITGKVQAKKQEKNHDIDKIIEKPLRYENKALSFDIDDENKIELKQNPAPVEENIISIIEEFSKNEIMSQKDYNEIQNFYNNLPQRERLVLEKIFNMF